MNKTEQLTEIWENEFGKEYTKRKFMSHDEERSKRQGSWESIFELMPDVKSVLEFGPNAGLNLECLANLDRELKIVGVEPNRYALDLANERSDGRYEVVEGDLFKSNVSEQFDCAFTCHLLIHIAPSDLLAAMKTVYAHSKKYILTMEYYWPEVKEIVYRGKTNALWKRDFGRTWLENFDVNLLETGYFGPECGFDRVTWWLFEKK